MVHRLTRKSVQSGDASDDGPQRRWDLRVTRVRPVILAVDCVFVNLRVERFAHLASRAGEVDYRAAIRDLVHGETMGLEPRSNRLDVLVCGTVLLSELLGSKPVMIIWRGSVLLLFK